MGILERERGTNRRVGYFVCYWYTELGWKKRTNLASLLFLSFTGPLSGTESPCIQPLFLGHGSVLAHFIGSAEVAGGTLRSGTAIWKEPHRHTDNKSGAE